MGKLVSCKECGHQVAPSAKTCPGCGVKNPAPQEIGLGGVLFLLLVFGVFYAMCSSGSEDGGVSDARKAEERAERREKGFHCLSSWDGSHRDVVETVKENLRDPSSFEHIETRITPVNSDGKHELFMEYRANNAFGGKVGGFARATVENSNCDAVITNIE